MAFCRLVFPLLVLSVLVNAETQVPVFIWGDSVTSIKSNPLAEITSEEFDNVLKRELKDEPFTVVFIEESLSSEDLSRKDGSGQSAYPYLRANIENALYLPAVNSPIRLLNKVADPDKVDHVKLTENGLSADIEPDSGNFLFINLKDAREGESRLDLLRRHNDFMEDMFSKLQEQFGRVVAIYTAYNPSWIVAEHSRVRRQAESSSNGFLMLPNLLLYYSTLVLEEGGNRVDLNQVTSNSTVLNGTELVASLSYPNNNVDLTFVSKGGYWSINSAYVTGTNLAETLLPVEPIYALLGFSYRCGQNISFSSVNDTRVVKLTFKDSQIQPFFNENDNSTTQNFGDPFDCVGFFSVPIWSGLFVVFILLSITFYGIMMMMDIRTMDRFDDPKGKTITINAAE